MIKKVSALLFAAIIILSGCKGQPQTPEQKPVDKTSPQEEILEHNKGINESEINLIQFQTPADGDAVAKITTTAGDVYTVLYPDEAPYATGRFIENVENGVYNGTEITKVINNFYIETTAKSNVNIRPEESEDAQIAEQDSVISSKIPLMAVNRRHESEETEDEDVNIPVGVEQSLNLWNFRGALAMRETEESNPVTDWSTIFMVQAMDVSEETLKEMEKAGYPEKVVAKYKEIGGIPGYDTNFTVFGQIISGMEILDEIAIALVDGNYLPLTPIRVKSITITQYDSANPTFADEQPEEPSANENSEENTQAV